MTPQQRLINDLKRTQWIIEQQTKDLTHQESLLQLPFPGNCMNWILGHVALHRDKMLATLNLDPSWSPEDAARYGRGSDPITAGDVTAIPLPDLITNLQQSLTTLTEALGHRTTDQLTTIYDADNDFTVADRLSFLIWHETYHIGQLELLRQLAGKNDAVIT
ncbi:MAG TPA: DinB family protein [Anaerolineae bacterium]|nr:DinB family protein [Anaerolineae bacterium]